MPNQINDKLISWASDIDPQTITQAEKTARLPIVEGHVALMPDAHVGIGATVGSVIPTKNAVIPSAVGVDIGCFRGDTRVPLLNGTQLSMQEMAENAGAFWVYAYDHDSGAIVPASATARRTRRNAPLVRVTVAGGDEVVCTPDHEFMLLDGTYKQAKDLRFNDSLMPLYRRWQARDGYESVSNGRGHSRQTHVLVYEAVFGPVPDDHVVHHRNHVHFDNSPENLVAMEKGAHSEYHRRNGHTFANDSEDFQVLRHAGIARRKADPAAQEKMARVGAANIVAYMRDRPDEFRAAVAGNGRRGAPYLAKFNTAPRECPDCGAVLANPAALRWHRERDHASNHKVLSVEALSERADVYCLQVPRFHNFALAVGVFVHNCGMIAAELSVSESQLPDNLEPLLSRIEKAIPAGVGQGHDRVARNAEAWLAANAPASELAEAKSDKVLKQFGTLGSGNHFFELCVDERQRVWVVLHSGSRGIGNQLAQQHIAKARQLAKDLEMRLEDPDLAYFLEGTPEFDAYIADMLWSQDYARANRDQMMDNAMREVLAFIGHGEETQRINCHHNFTQRETHNDASMWITRKGAIKADVGDLGVIPGSMGTRSYIVQGKGNAASWKSCSHGAGRRHSRTQAKKLYTTADLAEQMQGKVWLSTRADALVDEIPAAYKDIDQVMADQSDLVEVLHTLHQVLNYKGT